MFPVVFFVQGLVMMGAAGYMASEIRKDFSKSYVSKSTVATESALASFFATTGFFLSLFQVIG